MEKSNIKITRNPPNEPKKVQFKDIKIGSFIAYAYYEARIYFKIGYDSIWDFTEKRVNRYDIPEGEFYILDVDMHITKQC